MGLKRTIVVKCLDCECAMALEVEPAPASGSTLTVVVGNLWRLSPKKEVA